MPRTLPPSPKKQGTVPDPTGEEQVVDALHGQSVPRRVHFASLPRTNPNETADATVERVWSLEDNRPRP